MEAHKNIRSRIRPIQTLKRGGGVPGPYLGHRGLRVQHQVPEGPLEHPVELLAEGAVVGDGAGGGRRTRRRAVLALGDALQLGPRGGRGAAGPVVLHQTVLHALPAAAQVLHGHFYRETQ